MPINIKFYVYGINESQKATLRHAIKMNKNAIQHIHAQSRNG